jgi:hypothetical protein
MYRMFAQSALSSLLIYFTKGISMTDITTGNRDKRGKEPKKPKQPKPPKA